MDYSPLKRLSERLPKPLNYLFAIIVIIVFIGGMALFVTAVIGGPALIYFLIKKILGLEVAKGTESVIFIGLFIIGIVLFKIITRNKKKKCSSCQKITVESLIIRENLEKKVATPYCREHLIEAFLKIFKKQQAKAIIIQPQFTTPILKRGYCQYTRKELEEYYLIDLLGLDFDARIKKIQGTCAVCGKPGTIHYYTKPSFTIKKEVVKKILLLEPPRTLCRTCVAKELDRELRNNNQLYTEGLQLSEDVESAFFNFV